MTAAALDLAIATLRAAIQRVRDASADLPDTRVAQAYAWTLDDMQATADLLRCDRCEEAPREVVRESGYVCAACDADLDVCERCHRDTPLSELHGVDTADRL
jgi:hypothetical protein